MHHCAESIFKVREYESIFETALAHESVDPWVLFDEKKTRGQKYRETVPLSRLFLPYRLQACEVISLSLDQLKSTDMH
jgi:hypothetical protein